MHILVSVPIRSPQSSRKSHKGSSFILAPQTADAPTHMKKKNKHTTHSENTDFIEINQYTKSMYNFQHTCTHRQKYLKWAIHEGWTLFFFFFLILQLSIFSHSSGWQQTQGTRSASAECNCCRANTPLTHMSTQVFQQWAAEDLVVPWKTVKQRRQREGGSAHFGTLCRERC